MINSSQHMAERGSNLVVINLGQTLFFCEFDVVIAKVFSLFLIFFAFKFSMYFFYAVGSANVRIGLAKDQTPFNIPHCIAWRLKKSLPSNFTMIDQVTVWFFAFLNYPQSFSFRGVCK